MQSVVCPVEVPPVRHNNGPGNYTFIQRGLGWGGGAGVIDRHCAVAILQSTAY
jgi:hypothetical protein